MKILTVISNYNEERAISATIADLQRNSTIETDILVIDNCSTDNSLEVIKRLNTDFIAHPANTGGSAGVIKTAFAYAYFKDYDIYCHMDGDNQHLASELIHIVKPIISNEADVVTGSRYITKEGFQSSFSRRHGVFIFSKIMSWVAGRKYTDITSGFRAYNKRAITYFAKNFKQEIETVIQFELVMHFAGLKGKDVPVLMQPRTTGKSEINFINALKFPIYNMISFLGTVIQKYKRNAA
jgi:glycosyltransferase involved in cell wall biosynthesis